MRIWSLHPKYLDSKGLVALWRETLLAKHVLLGNTKGYRNHPQLERFKTAKDPLLAIDFYLSCVYKEASLRGFSFKREKFIHEKNSFHIPVSHEQLHYEFEHLMNKLKVRDPSKYALFRELQKFEIHPLFEVYDGSIESWEKIK